MLTRATCVMVTAFLAVLVAVFLTLLAARKTRYNMTKRSPVWEHFTDAEDTRFAVCNHCKRHISRGGKDAKSYNTTNIVNHCFSYIRTAWQQIANRSTGITTMTCLNCH